MKSKNEKGSQRGGQPLKDLQLGKSNGTLYMIVEYLLSAPASQAYVERIFTLCGMLTVGRRNRMLNSLEMKAFLKLKATLL